MIAGRRNGKPTDVKVMNCLNMLSRRNRTDRNGDLAYIAEQIRREYFPQICKDVVGMYTYTYLTCWPTVEELDDCGRKRWEEKMDPMHGVYCTDVIDGAS